ncbi:MAG: DUF5000 domain-containing lipoprotein [Bacteroidota bacterium]
MKKTLIYISLISLIIIHINCKEETIGQYPIDDIAPNTVSNVQVENLSGAVRLVYNIPDDEDLLYVKAVYQLADGKMGETKTSVFSNRMFIKGFGKSKKHTIQLISVDRSQNESEAVEVEIEPLDAPIYNIFETLTVEASFGGFKVYWENPSNEEIIVEALKKDTTTGEFNTLENFYSSASVAENSVRGLDSIAADFGIVIKDVFDNLTDTLNVKIKPYYEQEIPKEGFRGFPISSWYLEHNYSKGMNDMWDDVKNVDSNIFYIRTGNDIPPYFTIDLGVKAKLSRFRLWQRVNWLFALHNPKSFEWYGTNDESIANDSEDMNWQENSAWIKMGEFESKRPSGLQAGDPLTSEDEAYALAGEEFEFPLDAPEVRYLRFKLNTTWSGSTGLHINELTFWGQIEN